MMKSRWNAAETWLTARSLRVVSHRLRAQGVCDVVEFHQDPAGITLAGQDGTWQPYPVEYKKGRPNAYGADELQLCAQAICLEEMLLCSIAEGSLFYGRAAAAHPSQSGCAAASAGGRHAWGNACPVCTRVYPKSHSIQRVQCLLAQRGLPAEARESTPGHPLICGCTCRGRRKAYEKIPQHIVRPE